MTMTTTDIYRLGAFLSAGIEGERAEALVSFVRTIETEDPGRQARLKGELITRLVSQGMSLYDAHAVLLCMPSPHEPFGAIGSDYLNKKETRLGDDAESYGRPHPSR
jgi:hypothetical protein